MPDPTVIITLDSAGILRIEAPGFGSAPRDKIEGLTFDQLPAEIQASLLAQRDRIAAAKSAARRLPSVMDRPDPERERRARNEKIAAERMAAYREWLDSLPADQRAYQLDLQRKRSAEERHKEIQRAHAIWYNIAEDVRRGGVELANKVIADPKRRPAKARPSKSRVERAREGGKINLKKLTENVDYEIATW